MGPENRPPNRGLFLVQIWRARSWGKTEWTNVKLNCSLENGSGGSFNRDFQSSEDQIWGFPKSPMLTGFSIYKPLHFGVPLFLETPIWVRLLWKWPDLFRMPRSDDWLIIQIHSSSITHWSNHLKVYPTLQKLRLARLEVPYCIILPHTSSTFPDTILFDETWHLAIPIHVEGYQIAQVLILCQAVSSTPGIGASAIFAVFPNKISWLPCPPK